MASEIDPEIFPDNQKVDKSDLREQFTITKNEISTLQEATALPRLLAFNEASFDTL